MVSAEAVLHTRTPRSTSSQIFAVTVSGRYFNLILHGLGHFYLLVLFNWTIVALKKSIFLSLFWVFDNYLLEVFKLFFEFAIAIIMTNLP